MLVGKIGSSAQTALTRGRLLLVPRDDDNDDDGLATAIDTPMYRGYRVYTSRDGGT